MNIVSSIHSSGISTVEKWILIPLSFYGQSIPNDVRFETVVAQGFFQHCFSPCPKIYFSFYTVFSHSSHGNTNLVVWVAFLVQNRKEKVWSHVIVKIFVSAPSYRDFPFFDPVMANVHYKCRNKWNNSL